MKRKVNLTYFKKENDLLVGEISLPDMDLQIIRKLFDALDEDDMYGEIPLLEDNAKKLKRLVDINLDLDRYEYFFEYDSPVDQPSGT